MLAALRSTVADVDIYQADDLPILATGQKVTPVEPSGIYSIYDRPVPGSMVPRFPDPDLPHNYQLHF